MKCVLLLLFCIYILGAGCSLPPPASQGQGGGFDFLIERNSDRITVIQGSQGVLAFHVALLSGSPRNVQMSASGLPAGADIEFGDATVRFDREGGHPPFGSTYMVRVMTSPSIPLGTYTVTLVGTGGGLTRSASFQMEVVPLSGNRIYYVSPSGNDSNDGSSARPFRTIQKAADIAPAGDTVVVRAGVYHENVRPRNSGTAGSPITFVGEPGAVIDGNHRITGWEPAGGGVYQKPVSEIGFEPKAMAYQGKYATWLKPDSPHAGLIWGPKGSRMYNDTQGNAVDMWDIVGAYGHQSGDMAYLRLRTGGDPDDEDVTIGGDHAIRIDGNHHITIRGFTIQNGYGQVRITGGADNIIIEHNLVRGAQQSVYASGAGRVVIRNNDVTTNYFYPDQGHPLNQSGIAWFVFDQFRGEYSREYPDWNIRVDSSGDAQIYQNHVWRVYAAVTFQHYGNRIEIFNNYLHHCDGYCLFHHGLSGTVEVRDNLIYEATEGWRTGGWESANAKYYIYRNRFGQLTRVFTAGYCGGGRYCGRGRDLELYATNALRYIYHNSFTGNTGLELGPCTSDDNENANQGMPNTWVINNVVSAEMGFYDGAQEQMNCNTWHVGYNWVGGTHENGNGLGDAYVINGPGNKLHPGEIMWNYDNPSYYLPADTDARAAGIDLSRSWTMDGVEHPALPGMTPGYFSGSAPDLGVFQYREISASPVPTPIYLQDHILCPPRGQ